MSLAKVCKPAETGFLAIKWQIYTISGSQEHCGFKPVTEIIDIPHSLQKGKKSFDFDWCS